ncbi:MAG: nuclease, partial [Vibrio tubiashii]
VDVYGVPGLTAQALIDVSDKYMPIEESLLITR